MKGKEHSKLSVWARFKDRWISRKGLWSLIIALFVLVVSYWVGNWDAPFGVEGWPQRLASSRFGWIPTVGKADPGDRFLFVNAEYDKAVVQCFDTLAFDGGDGAPEGSVYPYCVGTTSIADRGKLIDLLTLLKKYDNYRFVFLDIDMDRHPYDIYDTALARQNRQLAELAASMRDVYAARGASPDGTPSEMFDTLLEPMSGQVSYSIGLKESGFIAEPLFPNGQPSIPMMLASQHKAMSFTHKGRLLYFCNGKLCRNKVSPRGFFQVESIDRASFHPDRYIDNQYLYLGRDLVDTATFVDAGDFDGKMIFVGAFDNEDFHVTPVGWYSGTTILASVLVALEQGRHIVRWWWALLLLICYCCYTNCLLLNTPIKVAPLADGAAAKQKIGHYSKKTLVLLFYVLVTTLLFFGLKMVSVFWLSTDYFFATPLFLLGIIGNVIKTWKKI